jgi:hypothetical protein
MSDLRQELHNMLDRLPEEVLEHARKALDYVSDPGKQLLSTERARSESGRTPSAIWVSTPHGPAAGFSQM